MKRTSREHQCARSPPLLQKERKRLVLALAAAATPASPSIPEHIKIGSEKVLNCAIYGKFFETCSSNSQSRSNFLSPSFLCRFPDPLRDIKGSCSDLHISPCCCHSRASAGSRTSTNTTSHLLLLLSRRVRRAPRLPFKKLFYVASLS